MVYTQPHPEVVEVFRDEAEIQHLRMELMACRRELRQSQDVQDTLHGQAETLQQQLEDAEDDNQKLREKIQKLGQAMKERDEKECSHVAQIQSLLDSNDQLQQDVQEKDLQIQDLEAKVEAYEADIDDLSQKLGSREVHEALEQLVGENTRLVKEVEILRGEADQEHHHAQQLEDELARLQLQAQDDHQLIEELQAANDGLKQSHHEPSPHPPVHQGQMSDDPDMDRICLCIQDYFKEHTDWIVEVQQLDASKPVYNFGVPINEEKYIKVVNNDVLVQVGNGFEDCHTWLDRCRTQDQVGGEFLHEPAHEFPGRLGDPRPDMSQRRSEVRPAGTPPVPPGAGRGGRGSPSGRPGTAGRTRTAGTGPRSTPSAPGTRTPTRTGSSANTMAAQERARNGFSSRTGNSATTTAARPKSAAAARPKSAASAGRGSSAGRAARSNDASH